MPLARLENFLKNLNGNTLYVDPSELDSSDTIENRGNSRTRPFKTIQRALLEATSFSYVPGTNNDLYDQTTILIAPGTHYIDNRPGYYWDGTNFRNVSNNIVSITEFTVASDFDLGSSSNQLYIYNSAEGGVIIPKGVSLVATDLRKTKIRPKFVPDPVNTSIKRSAIFRLTGGSYIFGFTIFDGNPTGGVYNTYTTNTVNPTYSHHKLTAFEYADGKNKLSDSPLTDLDNYYYKVSKGFGSYSGRAITDGLNDLQKNPEENKIVGDLGQGVVNISDLISGDGTTATTTITVTTVQEHGLTPLTPIQISGVSGSIEVQQQFNGSFVVAQVISPTQFTYLLQTPPSAADPALSSATVKIQSDTVSSSSPYVFNCSLKSVYGLNGLHADGSKATGFKSIVTAQFTGISLQRDDRAFVLYDPVSGTYQTQTSVGFGTALHQISKSLYRPEWESFHIKASNDAFIQCVSIFAIGYAKQFVADSGGDQSITNSNSNFGAISLYSTGFKDYQLPKDDSAFITHIIPPKDIDILESYINCYPIDVATTTTIGNTTRIYLKGFNNKFTLPNKKVRGYTIGARSDDSIYFPSYNGSAQISPNYQTTYNIDSITTGFNSIITVEGTLSGVSAGQAVRVISNNAVLPDGIENNKIYYVSSDNLTSNTLSLKESLSSTSNIFISNQKGLDTEDNVKLVFRVSDTLPGNVGSPFQFDDSKSNWYLNIVSNSEFISNLNGLEDPIFFIKRKIDLRTDDDKVYRVRMVVPKESLNTSDPSPGFILQKSSSALSDYYSVPNNIPLNSVSDNVTGVVRNKNIIVDAWATTVGLTTTVSIVTNKPHGLKVGNKVNIYEVKSSNDLIPVGLGSGTGFNGSFTVSSIVDNLTFRYIINRNPGVISPTTVSNTETWMDVRNCSSTSYRIPPYTIGIRDNLPYFTCEQINNDYQIYKIKTLQKYSQNRSDGIYHAYLNVFKNTPTVSPFNVEGYKLSQNLDNIYPELDLDNAVSDVESTISSASRQTIGKVEVNDPRLSTTKETIIEYLKDFGGGFEVSSISKSGNTCTITTTVDHNINGIRQLVRSNNGSGLSNGTFYDIPLCTLNGLGKGATVNVTVSGGSVSSLTISHPGSGYVINEILTIKGLPGSIDFPTCTVGSLIPENMGLVQVLGSLYPENNGVFEISNVTSNTISYTNSLGVSESSSIATIIPNIPTYSISSVGAYDSTSGTSLITTTKSHPFLVGSKVLFDTSNIEFTIVEVASVDTFKVSGLVPQNSVLVFSKLTSQVKETNNTNENLGTRHFSVPDGFKGRILQSLDSSTTSFTIRLSNTDTNSGLGLTKGDFIQVDDEIILINTITSSSATGIRGVLGTKPTSHLANSAFRRIIVQPVELRRNSILRASGHTFEYTGFGPGNYSTGMPSNQDRVLTNDEVLISQSLPAHGGLVVYTGMNSNGEFFIGRKKYDATTGDELDIVELPEEDTTFFDNLTVNKLTVNSSFDASTATVIKFPAQSIVEDFIKDDAVTNLKIADNAITNSKMANNSVNTDELVNDSVTIDKITFETALVPVGGIIMWSGSTTPTGWALCNGQNGTPDLRERFIVGAGGRNTTNPVDGGQNTDGYVIGEFDGSANSVVVSHNHGITEPNEGQGHRHKSARNDFAINQQYDGAGNYGRGQGSGGLYPFANPDTKDFSQLQTTGITINSQGVSGTNKNLPPYYALAFIMRIS